MRLLTFLFILCASRSFGQDYIITIKGDSLMGSVKFVSYDLLDKVQISTDKKKILTALQVREVKLNGETYKPQRSGNAIRFMKVLKSGYLSLFAFKPENQNLYDGRMLIKLDGKAMEAPNLGFKKAMSDFLGDCETVAEKIKSGEFGRKNLDGIIDAYNNSINEKTKALSKESTLLETSKDKLAAIIALKSKIEKTTDSKSKDAIDLLSDMETKVKKGETVANYQIETLKSLLSSVPEVAKELEQVLSLLK
ncbi:MAG: hypothetical protein HUM72_24985 [Dolichospermum sp.]|nr:hypothetical protein [Dolichospermum sp.]